MSDLLAIQRTPVEYAAAKYSEAMRERAKGAVTVLLIGPAGSGKTHQVWALANRHNRHGGISEDDVSIPEVHAVHVISEALDIDALRYKQDMLSAWCDFPRLLCVDDVGYRCGGNQAPSNWASHCVYAIATHRRSHGLPTVWTTNLTEQQLRLHYGDPVTSRLMGGVVIETGGEDRRQTRK